MLSVLLETLGLDGEFGVTFEEDDGVFFTLNHELES